MESVTDTFPPPKTRFFRITSRWPEIISKELIETHYGSQSKGTGSKVASVFDPVVDVLGPGAGGPRPKETGNNKIQPEYSVHLRTTANTDSFTPPIPCYNPLAETKNNTTCIQQKFFRSQIPRNTSRRTLLKICSSLAHIPGERISSAGATQRKNFQISPIKLRIKSLGTKKFKIVLPCTQVDPRLPVTEDGEQRGDGTCDRFIAMLPESCWDISQKASPLGLVPKLLPHGRVGESVRYIASCFWIWLCVVDDLTESLVGKDWEETESDLMQVFANNASGGCYYNAGSDAIKVSRALRSVIDKTDIQGGDSRVVDNSWRDAFKSTIREVLTGFQAERPLLGTKIALSDWMRVRMVTISARPFMVLARASLGLNLTLSNFGNPLIGDYIALDPDYRGCDTNLAKVECLLQVIMGLQNDILGWEKDLKTGNSLNAVQILTQDGMKPGAAMKAVIGAHNKLVRHLSDYGERAWIDSLSLEHPLIVDDNTSPQESHWSNIFSCDYGRNSAISMRLNSKKGSFISQRRHSIPDDNVQKYLELIVGFANGMANWMLVSKRYVA